jgi:polysaccharide biosynthesis/export protein
MISDQRRNARAVRRAPRRAWLAAWPLAAAWCVNAAAAPPKPADTPRTGAAQPAAAARAMPPATSRQPGLILGTGDIVTISVQGQPDLTTTLDVDGSGQIAVPLAGTITVGGLSSSAAARRIAAALRDRGIVVDPQVAVALVESRSQQVSVLGEVRTPGRFNIGAQLTVLDALALAGGVTPDGGAVAYLLRRNGAKTARYQLDLEQLARRGTAEFAHFELQAGDTLVVPKTELFYIYGEVKSPNAYSLKPGTTVMQALSLAGGLTERGSDRRVEIRRRDASGRLRQLPGELTDPVKADDILYVKERFF